MAATSQVSRLMTAWLEKLGHPMTAVEWRLFEETGSHLISMLEDHLKVSCMCTWLE